MSDCQLSIRIEQPFSDLVREDWLRRVVDCALVAAGVRTATEIGVVIAGDGTVQDLNRSYRGIDDTTDVLAFAFAEPGGDSGDEFVMPPDRPLHLGEVIVSYDRAVRQAEEQRHPVERELALLVAHGTLHLLGYDHEDPEDEKAMKAMEARVLDAVEQG